MPDSDNSEINFCNVSTFTLGKVMFFKTLKCASLVIIIIGISCNGAIYKFVTSESTVTKFHEKSGVISSVLFA